MGRGTEPPYLKGIPMQNITIGRYKPTPGGPFSNLPAPREEDDGSTVVSTTDVSVYYDGWIEGVRDDGSTWIMFLDAAGSPECYWARREEDGGVEGDAIDLRVS